MIEQIGDLPDRITTANDKPLVDGIYVLVVLNRALRGDDNPVIEAAIAHGNVLNKTIIVYLFFQKKTCASRARMNFEQGLS